MTPLARLLQGLLGDILMALAVGGMIAYFVIEAVKGLA